MTSGPMKEHNRLWHKSCYSLFSVDGILDWNDAVTFVATAEDNQDHDTMVQSKTKKSRRILTGNGTYLFYNDGDTSKLSQGSLLSRKESLMINRKNRERRTKLDATDPMPSSVMLEG